MSPISPDDLDRIFRNLDKSNKGQITAQELHHLLHQVGIHTTSLDELEKLVGRSSLDYLDFLFFYDAAIKPRLAEQHPDYVENDLFEAFKVFDLDCDGYISSEELQSVLSRMGLWDKRSGKDCKEMIGAYDENSDGVLDFDEFKNMMSVPSFH